MDFVNFFIVLGVVGVMVIMFVCLFVGLILYDCVLVVNLFGIKMVLFLLVFFVIVGC